MVWRPASAKLELLGYFAGGPNAYKAALISKLQ